MLPFGESFSCCIWILHPLGLCIILCLLTFPLRWNVDLLLNTRWLRKSHITITSCILVKKLMCDTWSTGHKFYSNCIQHGCAFGLFCKAFHNVRCSICNSSVAHQTDICGLHENYFYTSLSHLTRGHPIILPLQKQRQELQFQTLWSETTCTTAKCCCWTWGSLLNCYWKSCCIVTTKTNFTNHRTQNAFCSGVAIFFHCTVMWQRR